MTRFNKISCIILVLLLLLSIFSGCSTSTEAPGKLVISELVSANNNSFLVETLGAPDWIELYNGTKETIDLTGYTIIRTDATDKQYVIPSGSIAPGEYKVICATETIIENCDYLITGFNLPKKGTGVKIKNADGLTIDNVNLPELKDDISYCLTNGEFKYCQTPTPGGENAGIFAETLEEVEDAVIPTGLRINEACEEFVEVYNSGTEPISLAAFCLTDNISKKTKWRFPFETLNPGEYMLISLIGEGDIAASFRISSYETTIYICYGGEVYDSMDITGLWDGMSCGYNNSNELVYYMDTTPGTENSSEWLVSPNSKKWATMNP